MEQTTQQPAIHRLLGTKEVCATLGVADRTLRNLVARGDFPPPFQVGGLNRWRPDDIVDWINSRQQEAGPRQRRAGA